jgi:uncharacterized membrane protein YkvA (DUF1232 family)
VWCGWASVRLGVDDGVRSPERSRGVHAVDDALLRRRGLGDHLEKTWSLELAPPHAGHRHGENAAPVGAVVSNRAGVGGVGAELIRQAVAVGDVLRVLALGAGLLVATWGVMVVAATRLPPGSAKDLATVLPACATAARRLRGDPRVPRRAKIAVAVAGLWVLSPIDLIPEFLPVIGPLDDVIVVALALRYAARQLPRDVLMEAWPAEPRILDRLIGTAREAGP